MPRASTLGPLAELAQDQWGLLTRRQAYKAGVAPATLTRLISDSVLERVASGVYRLAGAPFPDHLELRAAWLQLAPDIPAWVRRPEQGVVSHRSAASLYGIGDWLDVWPQVWDDHGEVYQLIAELRNAAAMRRTDPRGGSSWSPDR